MLRWGVLGTGFISNTVVAAIAASDDSEVVGVAGRSEDRLHAFQAAHSIPVASTDYREIIEHPDVDVVYIGLPNHLHHELVIDAAAAGKAVLSEKSLTTTVATAHQLVDAVRGQIFFVEGLMYLAHPLYRTLVEILNGGELGTVRSINGRYAADIAAVVNPAGRGTIYNLGCYPVSLMHLVIQTALGPDAFADRTMFGVGTRTADDTIGEAAVTVKFGGGAVANLQSTDNYGMTHEFSIAGDLGVLRFETNPWLPVAGDNVLCIERYGEAPRRVVVNDAHDSFYHQVKLVERAWSD